MANIGTGAEKTCPRTEVAFVYRVHSGLKSGRQLAPAIDGRRQTKKRRQTALFAWIFGEGGHPTLHGGLRIAKSLILDLRHARIEL